MPRWSDDGFGVAIDVSLDIAVIVVPLVIVIIADVIIRDCLALTLLWNDTTKACSQLQYDDFLYIWRYVVSLLIRVVAYFQSRLNYNQVF